jgi:hypothetical protein
MLAVSGNYQNCQNGAVSNKLTGDGRGGGESLWGVTVNLLICDTEGALYSVPATV